MIATRGYRVTYKGYTFDIWQDFAGLDMQCAADTPNEVLMRGAGHELFCEVYDWSEAGNAGGLRLALESVGATVIDEVEIP